MLFFWQQSVRIILWKFETQFICEELLILTEYLMKRHIETPHNSRSLFGICHKVVLRVIKLHEYDLVDSFCTVVAEIIKLIIEMSVILQLVASDLWRYIL